MGLVRALSRPKDPGRSVPATVSWPKAGAIDWSRTSCDLVTKEVPRRQGPDGAECQIRAGCTGRIRTCDDSLNRRVPFHLATVQSGPGHWGVPGPGDRPPQVRRPPPPQERGGQLMSHHLKSCRVFKDRIPAQGNWLDPRVGFEPTSTGSGPAVLPLDDLGIGAGGSPRNRTLPARVRAGCSALEPRTLGPEGVAPPPRGLKVQCPTVGPRAPDRVFELR